MPPPDGSMWHVPHDMLRFWCATFGVSQLPGRMWQLSHVRPACAEYCGTACAARVSANITTAAHTAAPHIAMMTGARFTAADCTVRALRSPPSVRGEAFLHC